MVRPPVFAAVEGIVDEAVIRRLAQGLGLDVGTVYVQQGKENLRARLTGYNNAARFQPWIVLIDLDQGECAPAVRAEWLPIPAPNMCFRIADRSVESWLMADRDGLARFLRVSAAVIPRDAEVVRNPKEAMVNLARQSSVRAIREGMVPRPSAGRVGELYTRRLIEFVRDIWDPMKAATASDSLRRCIERLTERATVDLV